MISFDIISQIDLHKLADVINHANKEVVNRHDFKDSNSNFELNAKKHQIVITAANQELLKQMALILEEKSKQRLIDVRFFHYQEQEISQYQARQIIDLIHGISPNVGKQIAKFIEELKLDTVQASVNRGRVLVKTKVHEQVSFIIEALKKHNFSIPLQFEDFRDQDKDKVYSLNDMYNEKNFHSH